MTANVRLGRILGIPIGLHWSWFLIFGLLTWSLAEGFVPSEYPGVSGAGAWAIGAVTSIAFFTSVVLHELGHSVIALRNGVPVRSITLFVFGGVAAIEREPPSAGAELRIAIAGPLVSVALAVVFGGLGFVARDVPYLAAPALWLARINGLLVLFNLIPGYPLDGGRVFRAVVWRLTGSPRRATRVSTHVGQLVAFGFIALGIFTVTRGNVVNGLWLAMIGWFLQSAAASSLAQANLQDALSGVPVDVVMAPPGDPVTGGEVLERLVAERVLRGGRRSFVVAPDGRPLGMLTLSDVAEIPRERWAEVRAEDVMVPWDKIVRAAPGEPLLDALRRMDDANVNQLPVVDAGGAVVGLLAREDVVRYLRARAEVGI